MLSLIGTVVPTFIYSHKKKYSQKNTQKHTKNTSHVPVRGGELEGRCRETVPPWPWCAPTSALTCIHATIVFALPCLAKEKKMIKSSFPWDIFYIKTL